MEEIIKLLQSSDYKERFIGEYKLIKDKRDKLHRINIKNQAGTLGFEPNSPFYLLESQENAMTEYLEILELRAEHEHIEL